MIYFVLLTGLYGVLPFLGSQFLALFSAPSFAFFVYIVPLVCNYLVYRLQESEHSKLVAALVCPSLSVLSYISFAYLSVTSGAWAAFAKSNTVTNSSVELQVTQTPLDISQLVFIVILFYGASLVPHLLIQRRKNNARGEQYA